MQRQQKWQKAMVLLQPTSLWSIWESLASAKFVLTCLEVCERKRSPPFHPPQEYRQCPQNLCLCYWQYGLDVQHYQQQPFPSHYLPFALPKLKLSDSNTAACCLIRANNDIALCFLSFLFFFFCFGPFDFERKYAKQLTRNFIRNSREMPRRAQPVRCLGKLANEFIGYSGYLWLDLFTS